MQSVGLESNDNFLSLTYNSPTQKTNYAHFIVYINKKLYLHHRLVVAINNEKCVCITQICSAYIFSPEGRVLFI